MNASPLDIIKEYLRSTYQGGTHIEQSVDALNAMNRQNHQLFLNLLIQIVIVENDLNLKKSAIVQIKSMDFDSIFQSFLYFCQALSPELHSIVAILSEQLVKNYPNDTGHVFIECSGDNSNIIMKKICFMLLYPMLLLKNSLNPEIKNSIFRYLHDNCLFIIVFLESNQNLDPNMVVFFDYFLRCFGLMRYQQQFITNSNLLNFFEYFHFLTCTSYKRCISLTDTDIIGRCVTIYNFFISKVVQINNPELIHYIIEKINEVILCYKKYTIANRIVPEMFLLFNHYLKNIQYSTDNELTRKILIKYIYPQFIMKINTDDFSVDQFLDDNHPTIESDSFYECGVVSLNLLPNSDVISYIVFEFSYNTIDEFLKDPISHCKDIYQLLNFLTKFLKIETELNRDRIKYFFESKILSLIKAGFINVFLHCAICNFIEHIPSQLMNDVMNECLVFLKQILLLALPDKSYNGLLLYFAFKALKEIFQITNPDISQLFNQDEPNIIFEKAFLLTQSLPNTSAIESFKFLCYQYFPSDANPNLIINTLWESQTNFESVSNFICLFDAIFCRINEAHRNSVKLTILSLLENVVNSDYGYLFLKQCFDAVINILFNICKFLPDSDTFNRIGMLLMLILSKINIYDHSTEIAEPYSSFSMCMTMEAKSADQCIPILGFIKFSITTLNEKAKQMNNSMIISDDDFFTFSFEGLYAPLIKFKGNNDINKHFSNHQSFFLEMEYLDTDSKNNFLSSLYLSYPQFLLDNSAEIFCNAFNFDPEPLLLIFVDEVLQILKFYIASQNGNYNERIKYVISQYYQKTSHMDVEDINDEDNDEHGDIGVFLYYRIFDESLRSKMISINQIVSYLSSLAPMF